MAERDIERQRARERDTDRQRERETERQRDRERQRERVIEALCFWTKEQECRLPERN